MKSKHNRFLLAGALCALFVTFAFAGCGKKKAKVEITTPPPAIITQVPPPVQYFVTILIRDLEAANFTPEQISLIETEVVRAASQTALLSAPNYDVSAISQAATAAAIATLKNPALGLTDASQKINAVTVITKSAFESGASYQANLDSTGYLKLQAGIAKASTGALSEVGFTDSELLQAITAVSSAAVEKVKGTQPPQGTTVLQVLDAVSQGLTSGAVSSSTVFGGNKTTSVEAVFQAVMKSAAEPSTGVLTEAELVSLANQLPSSVEAGLQDGGASEEEITAAKNKATTFADQSVGDLTNLPVAAMDDVPLSTSNASTTNITVIGENIESYRYALITSGSCSNAIYSDLISVDTPIVESLSAIPDGSISVCVIGTSTLGKEQSKASATVYSWVKKTTASTASLQSAPAAVSSVTTLTLTVTGTDVIAYKYALIAGPSCANATFSAEKNVSIPISIDMSNSSTYPEGTYSLCTLGKDTAGNWQAAASVTRNTWTKTIPPTLSTFTLSDATSGSTLHTNATAVNANFVATGAAEYCVKTNSSPPSAEDSCWYNVSPLSVTVSSSAQTTLYGFAKSAGGGISAPSSASITHSSFTDFTGVATLTPAGGKHLKITWSPVTTPFNYTHYNVYVSTTSGGQNFSTPTHVVTNANTSVFGLYGLANNTTYYVVVRAANGSFEETNTNELSSTTLAYPTLPNTNPDLSVVNAAVASYFGGHSRHTIGPGEIVTVAGLYGDFSNSTDDPAVGLARFRPVIHDTEGISQDSAGNIYIANYSNYKVIKIDSLGNARVFAGNGTKGTSGNNGPATSAQIENVTSIAFDPSGNAYISQTETHVVRKISTDGLITHFAGTATAGHSGDGGQASVAQLHGPQGVSCDSSGNVYISEHSGKRVRKVTPAGVISTFAGNGTSGSTGDGGQATSAALSGMYALTFDRFGSAYIPDHLGHKVRKVTSAGVISTFAGTGVQSSTGDGAQAASATLNLPCGVSIDSADAVYITECGGNKIRKVLTTGVISTFAGTGVKNSSGDGGPAVSAELDKPVGILAHTDGNIYVSEHDSDVVRKITTSGLITTIAGRLAINGYTGDGGPGTSARVRVDTDNGYLAADSLGNLYIQNTWDSVVRKLSTDGIISAFAGTGVAGDFGNGGQASSAQLNGPGGIAFDTAGNMYIADWSNFVVRKVATDGVISVFAGDGNDGNGGNGGPALSASFDGVWGVAADYAGNVYVLDFNDARIRKVDTAGQISVYAGNGVQGYSGDGGLAVNASIYPYAGIVFDQNNVLYIADYYNHVIRSVKTDGTITTIAGTGTAGFSGDGGAATSAKLNYPHSIVVDLQGNILFTEQNNHLIRKIATSGIISTLYGSPTRPNFQGDGGPATAAGLLYPSGLAIDLQGNLFVSDESQHIRFIKAP